MYDAAYPPAHPPAWPAVAGYIGGNTPHVWTADEWAHQPARYRLPIWVQSHPGSADVARDAAAAVTMLHKLGAPKGCTVALDFETAVNASYVKAFDKVLHAAGYPVILYGSISTVTHNPRPSGGYWAAHYTGTPHQESGALATQYANGTAYDSNVIDATVPLWDTHPAPPPPPAATHPAPAIHVTPAATAAQALCREVWMTDGVYPVPPEWNGGAADNPTWMPASVLNYAVGLLREMSATLDKIQAANPNNHPTT